MEIMAKPNRNFTFLVIMYMMPPAITSASTTHLTTLEDLPKVPLTVVSPDFIRSVVVVAIATSGKNAATAATGSATLATFRAFFLLKTRDRKDGLVYSETAVS